ncbi:hypothetical protein A4X13_0g2205 [Tilletia indica]|uniref:Tyr recombinase domain-containing protein n=1 Tax=Tilletia indica TaxID=43049 RepID=A0A177TQX4_9BASI|nr:hypothetical protein A4X13_0g2205 [Tilletia indica]
MRSHRRSQSASPAPAVAPPSLASSSRRASLSTSAVSFQPRSRTSVSNNAESSRAHGQAILGSLSALTVSAPLSAVDVWASLAEDNVPTTTLTPAAAEALDRFDACALLSPARHLVEAVYGSLAPSAVQHLRLFQLQRVSPGTRSQYTGYVVNFLRWAEDLDVPHHLRFPIPASVLLIFYSSIATFYAESSLTKLVSALKFWHAVHGLPWALDRVQAKTVSQAFANLSLPKLDLRRPVRIEDFQAMRAHMDLHDGAHIAVFACALFALWSMARHGELTVRSASSPSPSRPRRSDVVRSRAAMGEPISSVLIHLAQDKTHGRAGFDRVVVSQARTSAMCPVRAFEWHFARNDVPPSAGVFAFRGRTGVVCELTSSLFLSTINGWLAAGGRPPLHGHAFRIGGATLLHANGVPIDSIKQMGGWASDVALRYIRDIHVRHAQVCADLSIDVLRQSHVRDAPAASSSLPSASIDPLP